MGQKTIYFLEFAGLRPQQSCSSVLSLVLPRKCALIQNPEILSIQSAYFRWHFEFSWHRGSLYFAGGEFQTNRKSFPSVQGRTNSSEGEKSPTMPWKNYISILQDRSQVTRRFG